jgi:hypothetical protein
VDVHIDESRKQRGVAQVDDFCALRMFDRGADGLDSLANHEDLSGLKHLAGVYLEQTGSVKNDGRGSSPLSKGWNQSHATNDEQGNPED